MKSTNAYRSARYRWRANQIAAKARRRLLRAEPEVQASGKGVYRPRLAAHLWMVIVKHRDGSRVTLHSDETPHGLTVSPRRMGRKIEMAMRFYRAGL